MGMMTYPEILKEKSTLKVRISFRNSKEKKIERISKQVIRNIINLILCSELLSKNLMNPEMF